MKIDDASTPVQEVTFDQLRSLFHEVAAPLKDEVAALRDELRDLKAGLRDGGEA